MKKFSNNLINGKNIKIGFINFFSRNKNIILPFVFILSYVLLYFLLDFSSQSLIAHDEGLYARRSRLVEESENWFSSPFSQPHHKTLGSYWLIALSIRLFGYSELVVRLPSILSSFLCVIISYLIALKITNKKSALISVFSLSSMPLWIQYSRYASPDLPFVLCILLVIFCFLKFLDTSKYINKSIYLFSSGLFISTAFFIRSYMVFVPVFGLLPFFLFHLLRSKNSFKIIFFTGLITGSIPSLINIYFSYKKFGTTAVSLLFDFAKDKAIGGIDFNNILLIPLNYLYLTFPVGLLFFLLVIFTKSDNKINYPLLTYVYPLLSLLLLICMSTSYLHYFLFLLPPLSILFAEKIQSHSFINSLSKNIFSSILIVFIIFISFSFLFSLFYYNDFLIEHSYGKVVLVYLVPLFMVLSLILSIRYLFDTRYSSYNLIKFFYNIIAPQFISISLLYNFGIIGNPNYKLKSFLKDQDVSSIIYKNTIYLYNVDSKINTLLRYYLPSSKVISSLKEINRYNYIITSDKKSLSEFDLNYSFKSINDFDNHFLLMNIRK
tara:strand:- start:2498 stop:4147 length:1650 start_codon:yes stop_codon:yes gene_type:complete